MIEVGGKEIIFDHSLIVPDGEEVTFEIPEPIGIKAKIIFDLSSTEHNPDIQWELVDQLLCINFKGWKNSLGTSLKKAVKLGDLKNGKSFGFNVVHFHVGEVNFLTINIFVGGNY